MTQPSSTRPTDRRPRPARNDTLQEQARTEEEGLVSGRNAVLEAAVAGTRHIDTLYVQRGSRFLAEQPALEERLRAEGGKIRLVPRETLDRLAGHSQHRGVVARMTPFLYTPYEEILAELTDGQLFRVVVADGVEDPRNLGALLRTAVGAGYGAVVLPKDRSCGVTETVLRTSAGMAAHVRVVRTGNCVDALDRLAGTGTWLYGLHMTGRDFRGVVPDERPSALVVGGERSGLREVVRKRCDELVGVPLAPGAESLNLAVAFAVVAFQLAGRKA